MPRGQMVLGCALAVLPVFAAPIPKADKTRLAILFGRHAPAPDPDEWFLVQPDGTGLRPYRDKGGRTEIVSLLNGPLVLREHREPARKDGLFPRVTAVTILQETGAEVKLSTQDDFVVDAADEAERALRREVADALARRAARPGATDRDREAAARAEKDVDDILGDVNLGSTILDCPLESSPDGSKILFGHYRTNRFVYFIYDLKRKRIDWLHRLVREPRGRTDPAEVTLSRDWSQLVYRVATHPGDPVRRRDFLHVADADGKNPRRVGEIADGKWTFTGSATPDDWLFATRGPGDTRGYATRLAESFRFRLGTLSPNRRYSMLTHHPKLPDGSFRTAEMVYDSTTGTVTELPKGFGHTWVWVTKESWDVAAPEPHGSVETRSAPLLPLRPLTHGAIGGVGPDSQIVAALSQQLGWTRFARLLPIEDRLKRDFYAEICRAERWSVRKLRDALLPKPISGELRVRDADRIVGRFTV